MTFDEWFLSKQGTPYDGAYPFARDAWNDAQIEALEQAAAWMESGAWRNEIGFVVLECTPTAAAEQLRKRIAALRSNAEGKRP